MGLAEKLGHGASGIVTENAAMYQPPAFREDRIDIQHGLIRSHPLGLLITAGPGGLMANPLPFLIESEISPRGTLRAHMARANPQWRELVAVDECLVVFQGPQQYVTPSWYATKKETSKVVPTWNYVTVHLWGQPQVIEDAAWLRGQIEDLTAMKETSRPDPWKVEDAPDSYIAAQMKGIVGIEIAIARSEGKWKVSQNRPAADRAGVVEGLRAEGADTMAMLVAGRGNGAD
jgi:transcriptional regulator